MEKPPTQQPETTDGFAETLAKAEESAGALQASDRSTSAAIGYELLGELGRGAMGVVYQARQVALGRIVALKMIRAGERADAEEIARFRSEAAAIAQLQHPNIVQIYEFGEHAGRPFFSLEFIDGGTLAQRIAGVCQTPRDAAQLVETLARAVHQAHLAMIVHRDLKPANVLLTREGVLKITDFGLAKHSKSDYAETMHDILLGTPLYMAPEQTLGQSNLVGPAADIYAIGAILYELLTGRPPFRRENLGDLLQAIRTQEAPQPRIFNPAIPRDLETICLKCLQKSPTSRYESAAAMADDLQRFLTDRPIVARPASSAERLWRWCRRNPWIAAPSAALLLLLLMATIVSSYAASSFRKISQTALQNENDAVKATKLADERARETRWELAKSRINEARMLRRSQRVGQQTEALARLIEARDIFRELKAEKFPISEADWQTLRNEAASALLVPDMITQARWPRPQGDVPKVASDLVLQRYVVINAGEPQAEIRRIGTGELLGTIPAPQGSTFTFGQFSGNGRRLELHSTSPDMIHFWDVVDEPRLLRSMPLPVHWRCLSYDGSVYAAGHGQPAARFIQVDDGKVIAETDLGMPVFGFPLHPTKPWAALHADKYLMVFDYQSQKLVWRQEIPELLNASWSQDGNWLLCANDHSMQAFRGATGLPLKPVTQFDQPGIFPLPASHLSLMLSTDWSSSLRVFDLHTGRLRIKSEAKFFSWPRPLGDGSLSLAFNDDSYLVLRPQGGRQKDFAEDGLVYSQINRAGNLMLVSRAGQPLDVYHLPSCERVGTLPAAWGDVPLGFEEGDRALLTYGNHAVLRTPVNLHSDDGWQFGPTSTVISSRVRDTWSMSAAGDVVAAPNFARGSVIYRLNADRTAPERIIPTQPQYDVRNVSVSPNGEWMVAGGHVNGTITVYATQDASKQKDLHASGGGRSAFSPRGEWLATGHFAGGGELFAVPSWKSQGKLPGIYTAITHDGNLLAVDNGMSTIEFYATQPLRKIGQLEIQDQARIAPQAFTPAGNGLLAHIHDGRRLVYFDLAGLRQDLQKIGLDWDFSQPANVTLTPPPAAITVLTPEQATAAHFRQVQTQAAKQQWPELMETLERRCRAVPDDFLCHFQQCVLCVYLNDEQAYRKAITRFKQRFSKSSNPGAQEQLAKSLALGRRWVALALQPAEVLAAVRADPPFPDFAGYIMVTAAMLDVGQQRFTSALDRLDRAEAWNAADWRHDWRLQIHLEQVRAQAQLAAGKREEAETAYADAADLFTEHLSEWPDEPDQIGSWQDLLVAYILRLDTELALFKSEQTPEQVQAFQSNRVSKVPPPELLTPPRDATLPGTGKRGERVAFAWNFAWQPVPDAESYQFELRAADGMPIIQPGPLAGPRWAQIWEAPLSAGRWTWKVRARVAGRWTAWSAENAFRVAEATTDNVASRIESVVWTPLESQGLKLLNFVDGPYEKIDLQGTAAVKATGQFLYFQIDPEFAHDLPPNVDAAYWLDVELFDQRKVRVDLQYDAHPLTVRDNDKWQLTPKNGRHLTATEAWSTIGFDLPLPRFANRQNAGADFRLSSWGQVVLIVRKISLYRETR